MTGLESRAAAVRPGAVVLRATAGEAEEPLLLFQAGFAVAPFSLGRRGDWRVRAQGVVDVHLYLWFDGMTLHAAVPRDVPPVALNDSPLGEDWSALADGAELRIGSALVQVSAPREMDDASDELAPGWESEGTQATSQNYRAGATKEERGASLGVLERMGLLRARRPTLRGVLVLVAVPAALVLWLAFAETERKARNARPASFPGAPAAESPSAPSAGAAPASASSSPVNLGLRSPGTSVRRERTESPLVAPVATGVLERRAADAVMRGDFQLASELYSRLVASEPDAKVFAVAQRISARNVEASAVVTPSVKPPY